MNKLIVIELAGETVSFSVPAKPKRKTAKAIKAINAVIKHVKKEVPEMKVHRFLPGKSKEQDILLKVVAPS